jgi:cysteinyl-tRNA synthetase
MKIFNTLSRQTEEIKPLEARKIRMYTCGLTVYSQPQIGNWVAYIYSDILTRTLIANKFDVYRVQNITDVGHLVSDDDGGEDKMEKGARREGLTAWDVAKKYTEIAEHEGYELLGLLRPNQLIPATSLIDKQIEFAQELSDKGYLYKIDDGMYFDTSKLTDYGKLARLDIAGLQAGTRVDMTGKKNVTDFAVWKFSPTSQKRDMEWDSPWGKGFPGWHLECSVIARESLGDQLDIHTGGIDHIPVHHTNEIAQTEAVTGRQFVKYWFHNNHLKVNGTKLSKSLGNSYTLQDITDKGYSLDAFKLLVLSSHYRTEGNFTWEIMQAAQNRINNWQAVADRRWQTDITSEIQPDISTQIITKLSDDVDTPGALSVIDKYFNDINESNTVPSPDSLLAIHKILGINLLQADISDSQKNLLALRKKARNEKDWQTSDKLRAELLNQGIGVDDLSIGQVWYRSA